MKLQHKKDTLRVNLLLKIVENNYKNDFQENIKFLDEAETISKEVKFKKGIAISLFYKGLIISRNSNYQFGDTYYKEAISLFNEINMHQQVINSYRNLSIFSNNQGNFNNAIHYRKQRVKYRERIGNEKVEEDLYYIGYYYYKIGKFDECISYYNKALLISDKNGNHKIFQECLTSIGNMYSHQGNHPLALKYLNQALENAKKFREPKNISDALISIGNIYIRIQDYDKAISFHKKALNEPNHDNYGSISHNLGESYKYKKEYEKSLEYFTAALNVYIKKHNRSDEAETLNKIGEIYFELNELHKANSYFENAKNINIEIENKRGLCGSYLGLGKIYFKKKQFNKALIFGLKCQKIANKLKLTDIQRDTEKLLFNIYKETGNYKKSLVSHIEYKKLNDSLFNKENIEKITQLEYEYKYKQALDSASIKELQLKKTVQTTSQNLEKSKRHYLWAIIGILLISIILGSIIFAQKLKNVKSKTQNVVMEQKLLRSQMTPHFIFNSLSVLQGMILNKEEKKSIHYLSKFSKLLRLTLENSRDKTVSLTQELRAVQDYLTLQNLENEAYKCTITVENTVNTKLFEVPPMLIQPFVENAVEHAFINQKENKKIDIRLRYLNKKLICTICDNGVGVNYQRYSKAKHKKSLSTTITSERIKILSKDLKIPGSVKIEDKQIYGKQGTLVTLEIPYIII
ncbi:tetratricopeptide repeat-containing sensor histidine kinase [Seonamhaeicola algicola]|uniref:tetratricopeptide repeat-containing sensor histidine kinase n=1 Tax=Seonamhaeicola algicola TaxID=1719036 RepID=UPI00164B8B06|nr:tetratricopeptide repeat protein [Seonamhaeicola algicola]